jgi:hypothetical protein
LEFCGNNKVIIGGDFNIDMLSTDSKTTQYKDLLKLFNVSITNNAVTRIASNTLIDHVLVANLDVENLLTLTAEKTRTSDHNALITCIDIHKKTVLKDNSFVIRNYDYEAMRSNFNYSVTTTLHPDVNLVLAELTDCITKVMNDNCDLKKYSLKSTSLIPDWANGKYFMMNKRIENIEKKICKLSRMNKPTTKLKTIQNRVKDELIKVNEKMAREYYSKLIKNNPACSWVVVNKILGKEVRNKNKIVLTEDNVTVSDDSSIAEIFANYFGQTVSTGNGSSLEPSFIGASQIKSMYFDPVNCEEVAEIIMSLDINKSPGHDSIPVKVLKEIVNELTVPLTDLINMIVMTSTYPDQMKYAHVIPLFKDGDKNSPKNYRGISLLSILNKIVEKVILKRLSDFMRHNKIDDTTQYGYREKFGTNDAVFKFVHQASMSLDKNDLLVVVFIDLQKAFDTVNHDVLLHKLHCIGIRGFLHDLLKSYLKDRFFSVKYGNCISLIRIILMGVPQGAILAPLLFNINLIDMQNLSLSSNCIKYADDLLMYKSCNKDLITEELASIVGRDIKLLEEYFIKNGLVINFAKTSFMILRNSCVSNLPYEIELNNGARIVRVEQQKYLGIMFDEKMDFKLQCDALLDKLTDVVRALRIIKNHLPTESLLQFFHAHFMSHIHYCAFLYAKFTKDNVLRMQRLQNWCIKAIFNLDKKHSTVDLYTNVIHNTLPIIGIIYHSMLSFIKKSQLYDSDLLPKYQQYTNNTRSNGTLKAAIFKRKNRLGNETSCLGIKLFNQLPEEIRKLNSLKKFKRQTKSYLLGIVDVLLASDQLSNRRISK